jgi:hypothetical protein
MAQFKFSDKNAFGGVGKVGGKPAQKAALKISPDEIKTLAMRYKIEIFCGAVCLATALFLMQFVGGQIEKAKALDNDIQLLADKETPVVSYKKNVEAAAALMGTLPRPLTENRFISYLTALAKKHGIVVTSIAPPENENAGFFRRSFTQVACVADDFTQAMMFINDIERSEYSLKIDFWKISPAAKLDPVAGSFGGRNDSSDGLSGDGDKPQKLNFVLKVSSIEILGDEKNKKD